MNHRLFDPRLISGILSFLPFEQYLENLVDVLNGTENEKQLIRRIHREMKQHDINYIPFSQNMLNLIDQFYELGFEELSFELCDLVIPPDSLQKLFVIPKQGQYNIANIVVINTRLFPVDIEIFHDKEIKVDSDLEMINVFGKNYFKIRNNNLYTQSPELARFGSPDPVVIGIIPPTFAYEWFLTYLETYGD